MKLLGLLLACFLLYGCTSFTYPTKDGKVKYRSFLQEKYFTVELPDGNKITYTTNSNPAVQLAQELSSLAQKTAKGGME